MLQSAEHVSSRFADTSHKIAAELVGAEPRPLTKTTTVQDKQSKERPRQDTKPQQNKPRDVKVLASRS